MQIIAPSKMSITSAKRFSSSSSAQCSLLRVQHAAALQGWAAAEAETRATHSMCLDRLLASSESSCLGGIGCYIGSILRCLRNHSFCVTLSCPCRKAKITAHRVVTPLLRALLLHRSIVLVLHALRRRLGTVWRVLFSFWMRASACARSPHL